MAGCAKILFVEGSMMWSKFFLGLLAICAVSSVPVSASAARVLISEE
jgi:hypothetical protein